MRNVKELRAVTGLRGIAAIYVVIFHFSDGIGFRNPLITFIAHGYLAVDLFFILSGFVMALNYKQMFVDKWTQAAYLKFLGRRLARVWPLYLAGTTFGLLLVVAGFKEPPTHAFSLGTTYLFNVAMIQSWGLIPSLDGPGWSISAEFAAYLLFPLLLVPTLFRGVRLAWLTAIVCLAGVVALCLLPPSLGHPDDPIGLLDISIPHLGLPVIRCLFEFTLGLVAFRITDGPFALRLENSRTMAWILCVATLAFMMIPKADAAVVALFPLLLISLAYGKGLPTRILSSSLADLAGRLSYSIYLTHAFMSGLMVPTHRLAEAHGFRHAQTYAAAVGIVLTIPTAYCCHRWIEVPSRKWLVKVLDRMGPTYPKKTSGAAY